MSKTSVPPEFNLGQVPKVSESDVGDGIDGNIDTIEAMKKVARLRAGDPLIRKLATNILQSYQIQSHFFLDEALAIGDYVKSRVRYVRDPDNIEHLQDPLKMVRDIQSGTAQGDCDDMSLLTATLLLSVGHQPLFRAVRYDQAMGNYNHIYVIEYDKNADGPEMRVVLDCILKNREIGSEVKHINGDDYPV